jgi:hypothetical protein
MASTFETGSNIFVNISETGPQGPRGSSVLSGSGEPNINLGELGDFYINNDTKEIYGPKTSEGWGFPTPIVGEAIQLGYVHTQNSPSDVWNITHGLGFIPNITVVDSAGTVVEGSYSYSGDGNTVVLTFIGSFSGKAYLS